MMFITLSMKQASMRTRRVDSRRASRKMSRTSSACATSSTILRSSWPSRNRTASDTTIFMYFASRGSCQLSLLSRRCPSTSSRLVPASLVSPQVPFALFAAHELKAPQVDDRTADEDVHHYVELAMLHPEAIHQRLHGIVGVLAQVEAQYDHRTHEGQCTDFRGV